MAQGHAHKRNIQSSTLQDFLKGKTRTSSVGPHSLKASSSESKARSKSEGPLAPQSTGRGALQHDEIARMIYLVYLFQVIHHLPPTSKRPNWVNGSFIVDTIDSSYLETAYMRSASSSYCWRFLSSIASSIDTINASLWFHGQSPFIETRRSARICQVPQNSWTDPHPFTAVSVDFQVPQALGDGRATAKMAVACSQLAWYSPTANPSLFSPCLRTWCLSPPPQDPWSKSFKSWTLTFATGFFSPHMNHNFAKVWGLIHKETCEKSPCWFFSGQNLDSVSGRAFLRMRPSWHHRIWIKPKHTSRIASLHFATN